jgi:hypothetical protein
MLFAATLLGGAARAEEPASTSASGAAVGLSLPVVLEEIRSPIKDGAHLFRPETIADANQKIRELRRAFAVGVVVETLPAAPAGEAGRLKKASAREVAAFFDHWAKERAAGFGLDGVYVLVCQEPKYVHVGTYPPASEEAFTSKNAERLRKHLVTELGKKGPGHDKALLAALAEVRSVVQDNLAARDSAIGWMTIAWVLAGILGFWLCLGLLRAKMTASSPGAPKAGEVGMLSGVLGGMFGTVAGHWIYDLLFKSDTPPPHPGVAGGSASVREEAFSSAGIEPAKESPPENETNERIHDE